MVTWWWSRGDAVVTSQSRGLGHAVVVDAVLLHVLLLLAVVEAPRLAVLVRLEAARKVQLRRQDT